jgi:hypothetical protein
MNLTLTQTAEHMQESKGYVRRLIADGRLTDLKAAAAKGKRHMFLIDSKQVKALMAERKAAQNGHAPRSRRAVAGPSVTAVSQGQNLFARLTRIESKLDRLVAMWS